MTTAQSVGMQVIAQPGLAVADAEDVDLVEVIVAVRLLLGLGARPLVIQDLTGASQPLIRNQARFEGVVTEDKGGRRPRSMVTIVESVDLHVEASIFLKTYLQLIAMYESEHKCDWGAQRIEVSELDVHGSLVRGAFIRAFFHLHCLQPGHTLTPDHARLVALAHSRGDVHLVDCDICPAIYLRSESALAAKPWQRGDCPVCRKLSAVGRDRVPVRISDKSQARQLYARIAGHGVSLDPPAESDTDEARAATG